MTFKIAKLATHSLALLLLWGTASLASDPQWTNLSSKNGQLPAPGESTQQTGALVADLDKDRINDFVISFRVVAPALVWYRRQGDGWKRFVIEKEFLTVEAGGAAHDIDGDGDQDIVFGNDSQGNKLWWWENPAPNFDAHVSWQRRTIKQGGSKQHHDQVFGDFKGTGKAQLAFWNQGAKTIFLADIPADPRHTEPWPMTAIFSGNAGEKGDQAGAYKYAEGATAADVDGDGKVIYSRAIIGSNISAATSSNRFRSALLAGASRRRNSNPENSCRSSSRRATAAARSSGTNARVSLRKRAIGSVTI